MSDNKSYSQKDILARSDLIFDARQISSAVDQIATALNTRLIDDYPVVLCVMQGGLIFTGHLLTRLSFDLQLDYLHVTRYQNDTVGHTLNWLVHPATNLSGRTVLILDDILDEGITLQAIIKYCEEQGAREVVSAVLLSKKHDRSVAGVNSDYVALEVDDKYVFGFGMDYHGHLRHLSSIYAISE